jgi:hypothetical protein
MPLNWLKNIVSDLDLASPRTPWTGLESPTFANMDILDSWDMLRYSGRASLFYAGFRQVSRGP